MLETQKGKEKMKNDVCISNSYSTGSGKKLLNTLKKIAI